MTRKILNSSQVDGLAHRYSAHNDVSDLNPLDCFSYSSLSCSIRFFGQDLHSLLFYTSQEIPLNSSLIIVSDESDTVVYSKQKI